MVVKVAQVQFLTAATRDSGGGGLAGQRKGKCVGLGCIALFYGIVNDTLIFISISTGLRFSLPSSAHKEW